MGSSHLNGTWNSKSNLRIFINIQKRQKKGNFINFLQVAIIIGFNYISLSKIINIINIFFYLFYFFRMKQGVEQMRKNFDNIQSDSFMQWKFKGFLQNRVTNRVDFLIKEDNKKSHFGMYGNIMNHMEIISSNQLIKEQNMPGRRLSFAKKKIFQKLVGLFRGFKARKALAPMKKKFKYLQNVIKELIKTEKDYVSDLETIQKFIQQPLEDLKILPEEEQKLLFANLKQIYQLNFDFLNQIQQSLSPNPFSFSKLGDCLIEFSSKFKIYFEYCNTYKSKIDKLPEIIKCNKEFALFIDSFKKLKESRFLQIDSFLIKPVQRLPKYILLLKDFIKNCDKEFIYYSKFTNAVELFEEVCRQNNEEMDSKHFLWINFLEYMQLLKLSELQRIYGDSINKLNLISQQRTYIGEDRLTFLIGSKEKEGIIYYFNDMIMLCKKINKSDFDFKFYQTFELNENSYCQILENRKFYSSLMRVFQQNCTLTLKFENQTTCDNALKILQSIILEFRKNYDYEQLIVLSPGTEQREINTSNEYTIYLIDIYLKLKCIQRIFLRYSQYKEINNYLQNQLQNLKIFHLNNNWEMTNNLIIEKRKFLMEHFLQTLLNSIEFQQNPNQNVLNILGLPKQFFELIKTGDLQIDYQQNEEQVMIRPRYQKKMTQTTTTQQSIVFKRPNLSPASRSSYAIQQLTRSSTLLNNQELQVDVIFHDETHMPMNVPWNYLALDLIQLIAQTIQLEDSCDFKLYEVALEKNKFTYMRPIANNESISSILNQKKAGLFQKTIKKSFLFRKYLFFPDDIMLFSQSKTRLRLMTFQIFYEIKRFYLTFSLKDYCICTAIFYILQNQKTELNLQLIEKVVPSDQIKKQGKSDWIKVVSEIYKGITMELNQLCIQDELILISKSKQEKLEQHQQYNYNRFVYLACMLLKVASQSPLFGITNYEVKLGKQCLMNLCELFSEQLKGPFENNQLSLGINYEGLHIVDSKKKTSLVNLMFNEIEEVNHFNDSIQIKVSKKTINFMTNQAFEIRNLLNEYEFLKKEVSKQK